MTIYLDKERASSEANAYVARVLAESSFWMAACALALSTAIVVVVMVYLAMYQTNHREKNDNADNINASSAMTIPQLERHNAFSDNAVCFLDSLTSSSCSCNAFSCRATSLVCCFYAFAWKASWNSEKRCFACSSFSRSLSYFCPASLCRNFSAILRDSMPGKFSNRLSLVMHNNNEFGKIAQEQFLTNIC